MVIRLIIFTTIGIALTACSPVYTVKQYGIKGTLIHSETGKPITRNPVTIRIDGTIIKKTSDRQGKVHVSPNKDFHWTWLGGPALMSTPNTAVEVECPGFEPIRYEYHRYQPAQPSGKTKSPISEKNGLLDFGNILLKKR